MDVRLDPHLAAYLADLRERGVPKIQTLTPEQGRAGFRMRTEMLREKAPPPQLPAVDERVIDGPAGPLRLRVYRPAVDRSLPTVLYVHGGGFVVCDLHTHDAICRRLAVDSGAVVASLEYRLAPEHRYPAAVQDALAGARWVRANLAELGGTSVWAMAGDSAGANLTAIATHELRGEDGPPMTAQLLLYPSVDAAPDYPSKVELAEGYGLEMASIDYFFGHYLGDSAVDLSDPWVSPLHFPDHEGLPPAIIVAAGFDPLRDEAHAYAAALTAAGVPVDLVDASTLIHGFGDLGPLSPAAAAAMQDAGRRLGARLS